MKKLLMCLLALLMITGCGKHETKTYEEQMQDTKYAAAPAQVMFMNFAEANHLDAKLDVLDITVVHMADYVDLPDNVYNIVSDQLFINDKRCSLNAYVTVDGDKYTFNYVTIKEFGGDVIMDHDDGTINF